MSGFKDKTSAMQEFLNSLATETYGISTEEALKQGICVNCKQPAAARCATVADKKEYGITAICGVCWKEIIGEPPSEPPVGDDEPAF